MTSRAQQQQQQSPPISRTCQNCAKAKIRCQKSDSTASCDRCLRLSKECIFPVARRRNNGTRKDHRIEALEAKINQLLETPRPPNGADAHSPTALRSPLSASAISPSAAPASSQQAQVQPQMRPRPGLTPASSSAGVAAPTAPAPVFSIATAQSSTGSAARARNVASPGCDVIDDGLISIAIANELLAVYKTFLTPHFPFVVIAPHVNAEALRKDKPFLFLSILAAACHQNLPLQRTLHDEIKRTISTRMILEGEVSMDLLQGLLVHLAWCHYHRRPRKYAILLQLAVSIVLELRIDRPRHAETRKLKDLGLGLKMTLEYLPEKSKWGRDERRAVAGCHFLSSTIAILLQRYSVFPYSPWIEECTNSVRLEAEYPTDKYIPDICHVQHLVEKMDKLVSRPNGELNRHSANVELFATMLRTELDTFASTLPYPMEESAVLVIQFHTAQVFLFQLGLTDHAAAPQGSPIANVSPWCLDLICGGLISAKTVLNFYLALPPGIELAFINTQWVQVGFILTIMAKLYSAATGPALAQSTTNLRRTLAMSSVINQCVARIGKLLTPALDPSGGHDSVFYDFELRIKRLKAWFEGHFAREPDLLPERDPDTPVGTRSVSPDYMQHMERTDPQWAREQQQRQADTVQGQGTATAGPSAEPSSAQTPLDPALMQDLDGLQWPPDATFDEMMGDWMLSYPGSGPN